VIKYFIHGSRTLLQNLTNLLKIDVIFLDRLAHPFWQHFEEETKRTRKNSKKKSKKQSFSLYGTTHSLTHSLIVVSPSCVCVFFYCDDLLFTLLCNALVTVTFLPKERDSKNTDFSSI
jgi:hypothetical protein